MPEISGFGFICFLFSVRRMLLGPDNFSPCTFDPPSEVFPDSPGSNIEESNWNRARRAQWPNHLARSRCGRKDVRVGNGVRVPLLPRLGTHGAFKSNLIDRNLKINSHPT